LKVNSSLGEEGLDGGHRSDAHDAGIAARVSVTNDSERKFEFLEGSIYWDMEIL
jgi:hypothetical protein